jgi:hypothetical protein
MGVIYAGRHTPSFDEGPRVNYEKVTGDPPSKAWITAALVFTIAIASIEVLIILLSFLASTSSVMVLVVGVVLALISMVCGSALGCVFYNSMLRKGFDKEKYKWVCWGGFFGAAIGVVVLAGLRSDGFSDLGQLAFTVTFSSLIIAIGAVHSLLHFRFDSDFNVYWVGEQYAAYRMHGETLKQVHGLGLAAFDRSVPLPPNSPNCSWINAFHKGIETERSGVSLASLYAPPS